MKYFVGTYSGNAGDEFNFTSVIILKSMDEWFTDEEINLLPDREDEKYFGTNEFVWLNPREVARDTCFEEMELSENAVKLINSLILIDVFEYVFEVMREIKNDIIQNQNLALFGSLDEEVISNIKELNQKMEAAKPNPWFGASNDLKNIYYNAKNDLYHYMESLGFDTSPGLYNILKSL